uniref:MULE transposase domain-containing protein n=1 Tax=Cajanus cajan TaxID=3821 RepID=A0A151SZN4_CAJCA|nr:hypothetical protein KK1_015723 [Cajanus cajan]
MVIRCVKDCPFNIRVSKSEYHEYWQLSLYENHTCHRTTKKIYICFEACKSAFVHTCRPLIGLDGCFLKGDYGGQLIAIVGKDGNNQMIPIAFAVVEPKTRDSWTWFIDLLLEELGSIKKKKWAFIFDQQKVIVCL